MDYIFNCSSIGQLEFIIYKFATKKKYFNEESRFIKRLSYIKLN